MCWHDVYMQENLIQRVYVKLQGEHLQNGFLREERKDRESSITG